MPKTQYNTAQYWQQRYKQTICEHYQWYCNPSHFITLLSDNIKFQECTHILELGCGSSTLSSDILKAIKKIDNQHLQNVKYICVDFSKELIKKQRALSAKSPYSTNTNYILGDIRQITSIKEIGSTPQMYDLIIDKATIDCLFCTNDFIKVVLKTMMDCYRLLKDGGRMVIISNTSSKQRNYLFRNKLVPFHKLKCFPFKNMENHGTVNDEHYYMYICEKGESGDLDCQLDGHISEENQNDQPQQQFEEQKGEKEVEKLGQAQRPKEGAQKGDKIVLESKKEITGQQQKPQQQDDQQLKKTDSKDNIEKVQKGSSENQSEKQAQYDMQDDFQEI